MPQNRFNVKDRGFVYPASTNPYHLKLIKGQKLVFCDHETERHRDEWRSVFPKSTTNSPLHVEIGCNAGHVLLKWAEQNPNNAYIGIDWKFKPIFRGAQKAASRGLENLLFFRAHAERIQFMFAPGEIDQISVFFPDPWPRRSQHKHRFLNPQNLAELAMVLKPGGILHIKTDHADYFDWIEKSVAETAPLWKIEEKTLDLHQSHQKPETLDIPDVTLFEKLFIRDKIPIRSLRLRRR